MFWLLLICLFHDAVAVSLAGLYYLAFHGKHAPGCLQTVVLRQHLPSLGAGNAQDCGVVPRCVCGKHKDCCMFNRIVA